MNSIKDVQLGSSPIIHEEIEIWYKIVKLLLGIHAGVVRFEDDNTVWNGNSVDESAMHGREQTVGNDKVVGGWISTPLSLRRASLAPERMATEVDYQTQP